MKHETVGYAIKHIDRMVVSAPENTLGIRDRALILVGFAGAMRFIEIAALRLTDLRFARTDGVYVHIRDDAAGKGAILRTVLLPYGKHLCPVEALENWVAALQRNSGPLFPRIDRHGNIGTRLMTPQGVGKAVRTAARRAGIVLDHPAASPLQAGLVRAAAQAGVREEAIRLHAGIRSVRALNCLIRGVPRRYVNPAEWVGL